MFSLPLALVGRLEPFWTGVAFLCSIATFGRRGVVFALFQGRGLIALGKRF